MLEDRRLAVLRAIVDDYVTTQEPVGSKALVERHNLGVSPATIRNDMAALEDEGYITQPHTSAGRVPTDLGYRMFVDQLSTVKPLTSAERRAIQSFLEDAVDLDDVMARTVRLLSQVTREVALVQYPTLSRSSVRHVEVVSLSTTRILVVLIADTGRVDQRMLDTAAPIDETIVADVRARIALVIGGRRFVEVPDLLVGFVESFDIHDRAFVTAVAAIVMELAVEKSDQRVMIGGTANLTRRGDGLPMNLQSVLEALEEQVVLLKLLGEATAGDAIMVRIGQENTVQGMEATSVVSTGYARGDELVASLGVVGPTHMDYASNMASVHAVAQYLGRILSDQ